MIRIEGKIRGHAKEKLKCNFCGYEQVSIYPYDYYAKGIECNNCGMTIALYDHYINTKNQVICAPFLYIRKCQSST